MPVKQIKEFLDNHAVKYLCIDHTPIYTAQEIAAVAHVSGKKFAKTVIVKADNQFMMVVVPATEHINFSELQALTGVADIDLAREAEFKNKFPDCEIGAMPPFGNLYNMPVLISNHLGKYEEIAFNAGTHAELLQMAYRDFVQLVKPQVIAMQ